MFHLLSFITHQYETETLESLLFFIMCHILQIPVHFPKGNKFASYMQVCTNKIDRSFLDFILKINSIEIMVFLIYYGSLYRHIYSNWLVLLLFTAWCLIAIGSCIQRFPSDKRAISIFGTMKTDLWSPTNPTEYLTKIFFVVFRFSFWLMQGSSIIRTFSACCVEYLKLNYLFTGIHTLKYKLLLLGIFVSELHIKR
jgi:hypothetical protein